MLPQGGAFGKILKSATAQHENNHRKKTTMKKANKSFRNGCILHDCLALDSQAGEAFAENFQTHITTDEVGNITHIIDKKVITPPQATWFELEGVAIDDRRKTMVELGLV